MHDGKVRIQEAQTVLQYAGSYCTLFYLFDALVTLASHEPTTLKTIHLYHRA